MATKSDYRRVQVILEDLGRIERELVEPAENKGAKGGAARNECEMKHRLAQLHKSVDRVVELRNGTLLGDGRSSDSIRQEAANRQ